MLELYLNTTTREWFDADGNPFSSRMPEMTYQSRETVRVYPKLTTPDAGEIGVDPSIWANDNSILNAEGIGALLTIDNDFTHKLKGSLSAEVASGTVASVTAKITNATQAIIPPSGVIRLFDAQGEAESVRYSSRNFLDGEITFTLVEGSSITGSYTTGSAMDVDQAPYCQCYFDPVESNLTAGYFAFELVIDSPRLRESMDYANIDFLPIEGLEVLFYTLDGDGNQEPMKAFLLDTFSITGVIGNLGYMGEVPDAQRNEIAAVVGLLLSAGFDVETQVVDSVAQIRLKLANLGEDSWSEWAAIGYQLKVQYSADNAAWGDTADDTTVYLRTSTDGGVTWSAGLLIKGDPGDNAGFGTPTAAVVTLDSDATATASVTASGDNTAKVFAFAFGIPKGQKGDTPVKGTDYFTEEDKAELVASLEDVLLNGEWGTEAEATEVEQ